jgi:hypothetical protein
MRIRVKLILMIACLITTATIGHAQSNAKTATTTVDSGEKTTVGGAGNKERIVMRVWLESVTHSDTSVTVSLNYDVRAEDKNLVGNWKYAYALADIAYTITITPSTGGPPISKSGTTLLKRDVRSKDVLYDFGLCRGITVGAISLKVTASRYGGPHGIEVTYQSP